MAEVVELTTGIVGYQVREADGVRRLGEIEGIGGRGIRIHRIPGHMRRHGYLPADAIARVDRVTDTVILVPGATLEQMLEAPEPPDGGATAWHMSDDWWADLLGHYGLFDPEGRGNEPFLHPDQR